MITKPTFKVWGKRECALDVAYVWSKAEVFELKKYFGRGYSQHLLFFEGAELTWYEDFAELYEIGKYLLHRFLNKRASVSQIYRAWHHDAKFFLLYLKKMQKIDLKNKTNKELAAICQKALDQNCLITRGYVTDIMQMYLPEVIKNKLELVYPKRDAKFNAYYSSLTASVQLSLAAQEKLALIDIALKIKVAPGVNNFFSANLTSILTKLTDWPAVNRLIKAHRNRFFWLGGNYTGKNFLDLEYFVGELKELVRESNSKLRLIRKKTVTFPSVIKKQKQRVIKLLRLDAEFIKIIKILEQIAVFHDERKQMILMPVYYLREWQKEAALRLGISRDEFVWLTPPEQIKAIKTGVVDLPEIRKRALKCLFYCNRDEELILTGTDADHFLQKAVIKEQINQIKGIIASTGVVKGKVKIVKTSVDLVKVKLGDILVTGMTTPDYVPAMRRASAIITDEGGITSHAAIVSRELRIPCIIGTKVATQLLSDGQWIKVDADLGVVHLL
ncbi:MAG: Phosphoenolpyruvate synthase/pyruvate phosphate dikinase [Parcubacteria group bacterium GW2011_GWC2_44_22]|nr:MAG: Phosphoenolpyruvate synthase/pyruvate phosphate dikinase [Parcubacteria group bacterium GW2011_GWC2_44_22]